MRIRTAINTFFLFVIVCLAVECQAYPVNENGSSCGQHSKKKYLHESYISNSSADYLLGIGGLRMYKYFGPSDREVAWVGRFNMLANFNGHFISEWHAPDGQIFDRHSFEGSARYAVDSLKIKNNIPENLYGRWSVIIFWDGEKIDEKYFYIDLEANLDKAREAEANKW